MSMISKATAPEWISTIFTIAMILIVGGGMLNDVNNLKADQPKVHDKLDKLLEDVSYMKGKMENNNASQRSDK